MRIIFSVLFLILLSASALSYSLAPASPSSPFPSAQAKPSRLVASADSPASSPVAETRTEPASMPASSDTKPQSASPKAEPVPAIPKPVAPEPEPLPVAQPEMTPAPMPSMSAPIVATSYAAQVEWEVFLRMNEERETAGLPALSWESVLGDLSRAHSADMIAKQYFSHKDPDGCGSSCRANEADYAWQAIGENIYMSSGYELSAAEGADMVVDGWMRSPGHRANILGKQYSHTGVGVTVRGEAVYVTAMYSKPR